MRAYHRGPAKVHRLHFPPPTWTPGQSVPPRNSGVEPNALEALERHAAAHEMDEQRRRFNGRRQPRPADRKVA